MAFIKQDEPYKERVGQCEQDLKSFIASMFLPILAVALFALILMPTGAQAEDAELNALKKKKANLTRKQEEIDRKAEPLGQELFQVLAELEVNNQKIEIYNSECDREFSANEEAAYRACESRRIALEQKGHSLESRRIALVNILQPYKNRWDELERQKGQTQADIDNLIESERNKPQVVDPRVVKGQMSPEEARIARVTDSKVRSSVLLGALMAGQGDYDKALSYLKEAEKLKPDDLGIKKAISYTMYLRDRPPSPKAEALLDALEYGQGDWQRSMDYLKSTYKKDPNNLPVRDALQFAEGMSGYWLPPEEIPLPPGYKAPLLKGEVHELTSKGMQSIGAREYEKAYDYFRKAHEQSPEDLGIRDVMNWVEGLLASETNVAMEKRLESLLKEDERRWLEDYFKEP